MAVARLEIEALLRDKASRALTGLRGKLGGVASTMGTVIRRAALLGAGLAIGVGVAATKMALDLDTALKQIQVGTGATGEALQRLQDDFRAVLRVVPDSAGAVSKAIQDLNTLTGETGPTLQAMAANALDAARMMGIDSAQLIQGAGRTIQRLGLQGDDAVAFFDQLFVASQKTQVPLTDLTRTLNDYGPVLTNLGVGLSEQIALFSQMEGAGLSVSRVMPGINAFMRRLAEQGVKDLSGGFADMIDRIKNATSESEALNIATKAFGAEGAQRLVVAARTGKLDVDALAESLIDASGAIQRTDEDTKPLVDRLRELRNRALVRLEPLFNRIADVIEDRVIPFMERNLPTAIDTLEEAWRDIGPTIEDVLETFKVGLDTVMPVVEDFVRFVVDNKPVLIAAIAAIGVAITLAFGPGAVAVVAILGLITLIGLLRQHWGSISAFIMDKLRMVGDFVDERMGSIDETITTVTMAIVSFIRDNWETIQAIIFGILNLVRINIEDTLTFIRDTIRFFAAVFRGDWSRAWELLKQIVFDRLRFMKERIGVVLDLIKNLFRLGWALIRETVLNILENLNSRIVQRGKDLVRGLWEGIASLRTWITDQVKGFAADIFNAVKDGLGKLNPFSPSEYGVEVGEGLVLGIEKGMQAAASRLSKGQQMLRFPETTVLAREAMATAPVSSGGIVVNIHIGSFGGATRGDAEDFGDMLVDVLRRRRQRFAR